MRDLQGRGEAARRKGKEEIKEPSLPLSSEKKSGNWNIFKGQRQTNKREKHVSIDKSFSIGLHSP